MRTKKSDKLNMVTIRRQIEIESIFLISVVAAVSFFFVIQRNNRGLPVVQTTSPLSIPAPERSTSQISPDGEKNVVMKITGNGDGTQTYSFFTADVSGANEKYIFSQTLGEGENMTTPYNTWSPDDKYFFIEENSKSGKKIFVFKGSGEVFSETEGYFEVTGIFKKQNTGNDFEEATGWASETLIIINSKKEDGSRASYWFEVPSKAIIPLSTDF